MDIRFRKDKGVTILEIDDARITFRNFTGVKGRYNKEGERSFAVVIPDRDLTMDEVNNILDTFDYAEMIEDEQRGPILLMDGVETFTVADALQNNVNRYGVGWNVRVKPPRNDGDSPFIYMNVKVNFNDRGPAVHLQTGRNRNRLKEGNVSTLDNIDIARVDMDIAASDKEVNGTNYRTAYLRSMLVTQHIDRFAADYDYDEE